MDGENQITPIIASHRPKMDDSPPKIHKKIIEKRVVEHERVYVDGWFFNSMINNDGFIVTEPAAISLDGKQKKLPHGPNSPEFFGTSYEDEQAFMERCRCECGSFKGKQFEGEICPFCNKPVQERETNMKMTAWLTMQSEEHPDVCYIVPYYYRLLQRMMGKEPFAQMINSDERVDKNGNRSRLIPGVDYDPLSPFDFIGPIGFYERFDEVIDYFKKKKKNYANDLEEIRKEKYKVFARYIPIYTPNYRPSSMTSDTFYFMGIDRQINPLFNLTEQLKSCEDIEVGYILARIQDRVNNIWEYNFDMINKKEGMIRNKLICGTLNYTARTVIVPDPRLRVDEVGVSYQQFRIQMKFTIIKYLMRIDNCTMSTAYYRWKDAYKFDEHVYNIMCMIIKREEPCILLNRNPTINYYSMLLMKIKYVSRDPYRTTLAVPLSILPGLNADFDGDILNSIIIILPEFKRMFRNFDPVKKYIISRTDGKLSDYFSIGKGCLVDLYHFATFTEDDDLDDDYNEDELMNHVKEEMKNSKMDPRYYLE